jgi:hypothetical protein
MIPMVMLQSKPPIRVRSILNAAPLTQALPVIAADFGLTCKIFPGMNQSSSGSAVAGFPCSKPPLNPIIKGFFQKVEAFLYRILLLKSTVYWKGTPGSENEKRTD